MGVRHVRAGKERESWSWKVKSEGRREEEVGKRGGAGEASSFNSKNLGMMPVSQTKPSVSVSQGSPVFLLIFLHWALKAAAHVWSGSDEKLSNYTRTAAVFDCMNESRWMQRGQRKEPEGVRDHRPLHYLSETGMLLVAWNAAKTKRLTTPSHNKQ